MSFEIKMLGKVRGIFLDLLPTGREDEQLQLTGQAEQLVAQGSAPYQEIVRQGRCFMATNSAVATVTGIPTTAYALALYNNESDGGRSYVIDQVWALYTTNTAALPHVGIIGVLSTVREAIPAAATGATPRQMNGMGNSDTKAKICIAADNPTGGGAGLLPSTTGLAANWIPLGTSVNAAVTSLPGFQQVVQIDGKIIVPPGRYFALHTLGSVTSSSAQLGVMWHEKLLTLG